MTNVGMAKLVHFQKLESFDCCGLSSVSQEAVQVIARSLPYSAELEGYGGLKRMENWS